MNKTASFGSSSPGLFPIREFASFSLRHLWRHRRSGGGLAALAVAVPLLMAIPLVGPYRWGLVGASAGFAILIVIMLGMSFVEASMKRGMEAVEGRARARARQDTKILIGRARKELKDRSSKDLNRVKRELKAAMKEPQTTDASLDIVSAFRALSPLFTGRPGLDKIKGSSEVEHGHAALMALIAEEAARRPGELAGQNFD